MSVVKALPSDPGVYQFFNKEGKIIYVGKAKNLKRRVLSYFQKEHTSRKTEVLVRQIEKIQHVVVDSEDDALLLENNLIKKYQPKYNILLKDDKTFPWICIKNEAFPRIFYTRKRIKDGSQYFGPYTSVFMAKTLLEVIKQLFPIRNCTLVLNPRNISENRFKRCLEYQIGNCYGPCESLYSKELYDEDVLNVKSILNGTLTPVFSFLKERMQLFADRLDFERALQYKQKIEILENYRSKSLVCSAVLTNLDVFSYHEKENLVMVNYFRIVDGSIVNTYLLEVRKRLEENQEEILSLCAVSIRERFKSTSQEVLVPFETQIPKAKVTVPVKGEKRKLLELCERNGKMALLEKIKNDSAKAPATKSSRILETLQKDLRLPKPPQWIECFDNSNISGEFPVSSCVVFKDAVPHKSQYRHFNVKQVVGPNDFATMEEVVRRRYTRQVEEGNRLPDLIVIDGGKGQLSAAFGILQELSLADRIPMIGIAKRLEEIYYPSDPLPLYLDKKSESMKVLQHLRDEAHRFGITFHRNKRSQGFTDSMLEKIEGVGKKSAEKLLGVYHSVEKLKTIPVEEMAKQVGLERARKIKNYLAGSN